MKSCAEEDMCIVLHRWMQKAMESWHIGFNCQNDKEKKVMMDEKEKVLS